MESSNLEIFILTLGAALVASLIGFIVKHIKEKYFSFIPIIKIDTSYKCNTAHNFDNTLKVNWNINVKFRNISTHTAYNLYIKYTNSNNYISLQSRFSENDLLRGFESSERYIYIEKLIPYDEIINRDKICTDFMPQEIKELSFLLIFENEKRKKFYLIYKDKKSKTYRTKRKIVREFLKH